MTARGPKLLLFPERVVFFVYAGVPEPPELVSTIAHTHSALTPHAKVRA